jgi:O-antigen/teichoic acid export membrane protein
MSTLSTLQRAKEFVTAFPDGFIRADGNWGFVRGFSILTGGSALAQMFSIALAPLITRLYLPDNLGQMGLFMAFLNVAIVTTALRYELAIVSAQNSREAAQLTFCSFLLALPVSAAAGLTFYGMVRFGILGYGNMPSYAAVLIVLALVSTACFSAIRYWLLRQARFGLITHGTVLQNAGRAFSQAGFGFLGPHTAGLLAGEILGRCFGLSRMLRASWTPLRREFGDSKLPHLKDTLRRNRRFALYSLPSSLLNSVAASISLPLIVYLYGLDAGGSYALVSRVLTLPAVLITANLADAFHRRAALIWQHDPMALPGLVKRMAAALGFVAAGPAAMLIAFGQQSFQRVFGSRWMEAGVMAVWMAPWFLAHFIVSPLSRVALVVGRQEVELIYDIVTSAGTIGLFIIAHYARWQIMTAIAALAALKTAAYALFFLLLLNISSPNRQKARSIIGELP